MGLKGSLRNVSTGVVTIPDSEDLQAHYDASHLSSVDPWPAEVGPDLTVEGEPSVVTDEKNGNNVVRYDGTDDGHFGSFASAVTQPVHIFGVVRFRSLTSDAAYVFGTTGDTDNRAGFTEGSSDEWGISAGTTITGGVSDTNWQVVNIYFDGANSYLRLNGTEIISRDAGAGDYLGVALGWLEWNNGNYAPADVGQYLSYPMSKESVETDVESYLNDKWRVY